MTPVLKRELPLLPLAKRVALAAALGLTFMAPTDAHAASATSATFKESLNQASLTDGLQVSGMADVQPDTAPVPVVTVAPKYPNRAIVKEREGWVIVEMDVDEYGLPKNASIVEAANMVFAKSALNAVEKFRFKPATLEGKPVAVSGKRYKVVYSFQDS